MSELAFAIITYSQNSLFNIKGGDKSRETFTRQKLRSFSVMYACMGYPFSYRCQQTSPRTYYYLLFSFVGLSKENLVGL